MKCVLDGTVAMVTGASSGLGEAFARQLASRARVLILVARREERLQTIASELGAAHDCTVEVRPCDLANIDAIDELVEQVLAEHGSVDVLINNAGMGDLALFADASRDKLHAMIAVNVVGLTRLTHGLIPAMCAQGRGGILNVSSVAGLFWSSAYAVYSGTKYFVTAFTESLRAEFIDKGVVVTGLYPGPVATEFVSISGNPFKIDPPSFAELSALDCARMGLKALERGRAAHIPGWTSKLLVGLVWLTPSPVLRYVQVLVARFIRMRARQAGSEPRG